MKLTIPLRSHHVIRPVRPLRAALADTLSLRQQSIVAIAASAATGALEHLRTALARGLDGGMTVNETKEVMVHAYAYCGFPRSLRGLQPPPMQVLDERKARGIADTVGRDAQARLRQPRQAHPRAELLEKLSGAPADAAVALRHLPAPGAHGRPAPPDDEIVNGLKKDAPLARGMLMPDNPNFTGGRGRGCKAMPARRMVSTARGGRRDFRPRVP